MSQEARQRCEAAGIPEHEIARIDEAVSKFDDAVIREDAVDMLIDAWKRDHS